jgi:hypothetical protein
LSPSSLVPVAIAHVVDIVIAIALVAVAHPPPLLLPLTTLSHATLIANAMALANSALFAARHLIAVTIALATLALFIAGLIIRRMLSLFVVALHRGCVVIDALLLATAHY